MPNINSIITDLAGQAISAKLSGNKHKDKKQDKDSKGGLNFGSALNQISSAISGSSSSKAKDSHHQTPPSDPHTTMSGYPPNNPYQPTQNPPSQGYPGYPPNQPPTSGYPDYGGAPYPGSGGASSGGIGFNIDSGPGYPPQSQPYAGPGYPSSGPGYPTSGSGQPPYPQSGTGGAYQPNVGYGQPGVGSGYGQPGGGSGYGQPSGGSGYGAPSYPPTSGYPQQTPQSQPYPTGSVYPTHASDSVQQFYGGPPQGQQQHQSGGGYPGQRPNSGNMYQSGGTPTIKPNPNFNANHSAEMLRKAMKGFGCDKNKVVQALCVCNNWQRQEVIKQFKVMYGKDLISELKSELSGDFEDLIMALMETPARYDAQQLRKAMAGIGTKESVLIEIMTTRSNAQVQELKYTYKQLYGKDLEHDLIGETSGHFKRLLVSLCAAGRDESWNVDPLRANQDARALYRAGEQRLGTDESTFNAILASQNFHQLRMVFDEYQKVSNHTIEHAIQAEFSSDIRDGLLAIVKSIRNRAAYFAELIYNSMVGLGTRDTDLIRLIVTRSEIDLADIRNQYQSQYRTSLEKAIAGDCNGAYKEGLISLVTGSDQKSGTTLMLVLRPNEVILTSDTRASDKNPETGEYELFETNFNKVLHYRLVDDTIITVAIAGDAKKVILQDLDHEMATCANIVAASELLASKEKTQFFLVGNDNGTLAAWKIQKKKAKPCTTNFIYIIGGNERALSKRIVEIGEEEALQEPAWQRTLLRALRGKDRKADLGPFDNNCLFERMFKAFSRIALTHPATGDRFRRTIITKTERRETVEQLHNDQLRLQILRKHFLRRTLSDIVQASDFESREPKHCIMNVTQTETVKTLEDLAPRQ